MPSPDDLATDHPARAGVRAMSSDLRPDVRRTDVTADERSTLTAPLLALLGTEVLHIASTVANDGQPKAHHAEIGPPLHLAAVIATIGLLVWVRRRGRHAPLLTAAAGGAVVLAAVLYHLLPIDSDVTNPFFDGGATALQQFSVLAGIAAGTWCVVRGWCAGRRRRPVSPR